MAQGSSSALVVVFLSVTAMALFLNSQSAEAAVYTVNWGPFVAAPKTKMRAGDTLVFNYGSVFHSLWVVTKDGYNNCTVPPGSRFYQTGNDKITLAKGMNYFICGFPFHCLLFGMRMAVNAA